MSEEEEQAIEYFENLDIDLNTLWRIDLKGLEKRRKQILKLVKKLQTKLEESNKITGTLIENYKEEAYILGRADETKSMQAVIEKHYISKDIVREKIKELKDAIEKEEEETCGRCITIDKWRAIEVLKELLGE